MKTHQKIKTNLPIKIIFSGGGTGGHLYPALAIAKALKNKIPQVEILFVGALNKIEMKEVPKEGFDIKGLWISGFSRKLTLDSLLFPLKILSSLWKSFFIIKKFSPNLIIGTGGYASGSLVFMGALFKIPTLIQEQNSIPGITNKILSKYVNSICIAYKGVEKYFPKSKIIFSGNPLRENFSFLLSKKEACKKLGLDENKPVILSLGGSGGASSINKAWAENIKNIKEAQIQLIWQIGKKDYNEFKKDSKFLDPQLLLFEFIEDMVAVYSAADLIISRGGALSISELAIIGKPCLLIPYPFASDDHQKKNIQVLLNNEAALMIEDHKLKENLVKESIELLKNEKLKEKLSKNIKNFATYDALDKIIEECMKLIHLK